MVHSGAFRYVLHPRSFSYPKLSRLAVDLLQSWPPLSHSSGRKEASPRNFYAYGVTRFAQGSEVRVQESYHNSGGKALGSSVLRLQKGSKTTKSASRRFLHQTARPESV